MTDPLTVLQDVFGYAEFRHHQRAVIDAVIDGEDGLVVMPTGGGKSLCYQIPALVRDGVAIVVSPLIALMHDQVSALAQLGIAADFLNSTQTSAERARVWRQLELGELSLLYVAPERLVQAATLERLSAMRVALIAVDEAHCVSQWGHDFRRDYLSLDRLAAAFPGVPRIALTATATPRTRDDIVRNLALTQAHRWVAGFDRPNIRYSVQVKTDARRQLSTFLTRHKGSAGIVYALSRKKVDSTAQWLCDQGFNALPYHAGLDAEIRALNQSRFLREDDVIICATIAFGMGIDKPDVRFVAHLDLPKSVEAYYQETGRAGRDGDAAEAFMVYGLQDVVRLRQMVDESEANDAHKRSERAKLDALLGWCETTVCRRQGLLAYFGDELTHNCGNCDVCLTPPEVYDGTVAAQKLMSAIYRTGQRFGAAHVVDVLLGKSTDKVTQNGHDQLTVFGIGSDTEANHWRSVVRQLIARGLITADAARYGALTLAEDSRALLRGEVELSLRRDPKVKRTRSRTSRARVEHALNSQDDQLFELLRATRAELATQNGVPAYVIFHDATLLQMVHARPVTEEELLAVNGVGASKLERYGDAFLEVMRDYSSDQASR
ncbi:MAG: DNA helicase RecQ [Gammaproteobacteria bacterium]